MQLLGFPTLIAGLVLLFAGSHWFSGAHTVGLILTIVSGAAILLGWLIVALVFGAAAKTGVSVKRRR